MSNPLLVGIDVHRPINAVRAMDRPGQELVPRFVVDNNRPGHMCLVISIVTNNLKPFFIFSSILCINVA